MTSEALRHWAAVKRLKIEAGAAALCRLAFALR
ncbi:hypothetical protein CCACVL1_00440, partial [Corchorus capsularis]